MRRLALAVVLLASPIADAQTDAPGVDALPPADSTVAVGAEGLTIDGSDVPPLSPPPASAVVAAPAAAVPTARAKSPALGHVFGYLLPGGGHFYAGEPSTGGVLLGTYVAGAAIALPALLAQGVCQVVGAYSPCQPSAASSAQIVIGSVMAGGALLYSVVDGGRAVRRTNRSNGYAAATPRATVAPHGAGLAMRVRF